MNSRNVQVIDIGAMDCRERHIITVIDDFEEIDPICYTIYDYKNFFIFRRCVIVGCVVSDHSYKRISFNHIEDHSSTIQKIWKWLPESNTKE